jgi:hypothetical protein
MSDFVNTLDLIGDEALTKALIEKTVTEYKDDVVEFAGHLSFANCTALTSVDMPNVTSAQIFSFLGCSNLTNVNLPNATAIDSRAFENCAALTKLDLPKVSSIDDTAFQYCGNLKTLVLRNNAVCSLGNTNAFGYTPFTSGGSGGKCLVPRAQVTNYQNATNWSTLYAAGSCTFLALEDYTVDGTTTGEVNWGLFSVTRALISRTIGEYSDETVTSVRGSAFNSCSKLTSVDMPNATSVGISAFNSCSKLTSVNIPNVTSIGNSAFQSCSKLTSVDMPNATSVGISAFNYCSNLTSVRLPATPPNLTNANAFTSISSECVFYIPAGSLEAYQSSTNWSALTSKYSFMEEGR